jgi:tRNA threonylcarbamoyl adenosine modification protein (Sua5/YciO/YrdC/YwlC family)
VDAPGVVISFAESWLNFFRTSRTAPAAPHQAGGGDHAQGRLVAFPTDSAYALGGITGDNALLARIRRIRGVDERHHFTLICRDLSDIATCAGRQQPVPAAQGHHAGAYTFILEGTKELPRRVLHPKRKTIGLRVPDHPVVAALLAELGEPMLSSTLLLPDEETPLTDAEEIRERLEKEVDLIIEAGPCRGEATTIIDLTSGTPELIREGRGSLAPSGFERRPRRGCAPALLESQPPRTDSMQEFISTLTIWALPVLFAITLHEAAHGYAARHFGDRTAELAGRISLNPLRHIDPMGTIVVPALILVTSSLAAGSAMLFGWAKPVPVNFGRLRNPKADMLWVAAAGPLANLVMAIGWALLFRLAMMISDSDYDPAGPDGRRGHADQRGADDPQPAAAAAPRRRAHCGEPAARRPGLQVCAARALRLPHPAALAVHGYPWRHPRPLVAIFRFVLAIVFGL